ncbi:hypothetical protein QFZ66_004772 [Streptomyces sp. B4I13]|uniref:ATP-binding protein n=1 Tax=Streptomyces sp. B4I13 TaxID=3042271 RepID=UPI002783B8D4|nr:ATP-binding protein [Streptomyces sp. B4I13]MDQ0960894.1 hypothetical protein [Streptomyces sp. B4I13]
MVVNTPDERGPPTGDDERIEPPTSLSGWRRFVEKDPATFDLAPLKRWEAMDDEERADYDEVCIDYHSELQVVRTTGKTTALRQLGRLHELRIRQRYGDSRRIPVVYVTAPPKGSARKLALEFARFLKLPTISPRHTTADITSSVCQVLTEARTDLVLVDEIHLMNLATIAGEELSDHLMYFTERLPATFVYAGIDVEHSGLFTGIRGAQIAGRCTLLHTSPFPPGAEWEGLVATMEDTLRLHHHTPGTLTKLHAYLHQRTGGMIGSLSHLIRAAAISAILDGSERVTRRQLHTIHVDHASESAYRTTRPCGPTLHGSPCSTGFRPNAYSAASTQRNRPWTT